MWIQVRAAKCDRCGHEWLPSGEPKRCAKCKSPGWNSSPSVGPQKKPKQSDYRNPITAAFEDAEPELRKIFSEERPFKSFPRSGKKEGF